MNHWRSYLLIACVLASGCAVGTGSRAHPPVAASAGPSQTHTYSAPRNHLPIAHRSEARETPIARETPASHVQRVTFLSPRMADFYRANLRLESVNAARSKADMNQAGSPAKSSGGNEATSKRPMGPMAFGQISNRQVLAASLFPAVEPHYAGLIAVVIVFVAMTYFLLLKIANFIRQAARTIPLGSGDGFADENQSPSQGSSSVSGQERAQTPEFQSRLKRTFEKN